MPYPRVLHRAFFCHPRLPAGPLLHLRAVRVREATVVRAASAWLCAAIAMLCSPLSGVQAQARPTRWSPSIIRSFGDRAIQSTVRIELVDDVLVAVQRAEPTIALFDIRSGTLLTAFGIKNGSAGMAMRPSSIAAHPGGSAFWIYEATPRRWTLFRLVSSGRANKRCVAEQVHGLPTVDSAGRPILLESPIWIDSKTAVMSAILDGGTLARWDVGAKTVSPFGPDPGGDARVDYVNRGMANRGRVASRPDGSAYAQALYYANQVRSISRSGDLVAKSCIGECFDPVVRYPARDGFPPFHVLDPEQRYGYRDLAVSPSYIFALYSGKLTSLSDIHGTEVHVFTWGGVPVGVIALPRPGNAVALTGNADALIVSRDGADAGFDVYALPDALHRTEKSGSAAVKRP